MLLADLTVQHSTIFGCNINYSIQPHLITLKVITQACIGTCTDICNLSLWMIIMEYPIISKAQDLTDIELAILLSLVADQHCIIETEHSALNSLQDEISMVR